MNSDPPLICRIDFAGIRIQPSEIPLEPLEDDGAVSGLRRAY